MKKTDWFDWRQQVVSCRSCSNATKVWLFAVATFADEFGFCFPNQSQVAERMGRDTRGGLHRYANQAEECEHIIQGMKKTTEGKWSSNYTLRLKHGASVDTQDVMKQDASGVKQDASGMKQDASQVKHGDALTPPLTPSLTPSINTYINDMGWIDQDVEEIEHLFPLDALARVEPSIKTKYPEQTPGLQKHFDRQARINAEFMAELGVDA